MLLRLVVSDVYYMCLKKQTLHGQLSDIRYGWKYTMTEQLSVTMVFPASVKEIYETWLDSKKHSAMTGSKATIDPGIGGKFTAWDGYIKGTTIEIEPNQRIVQEWRTTDFSEDDTDSIIEIIMEEVEKGTKITLIHTEIPAGQADDYRKGWEDFYFTPMKSYFESL
jgi:activator of HSP90 ATPase